MFKKDTAHKNKSDEELMAMICLGETNAFDELYFRYRKRLMAYFMRMLWYDQMMAEDAVQDLFLKIADKPDNFDGSRLFKTWIFSVASNYCKNVYRSQEVRKKHLDYLMVQKEKTFSVDVQSEWKADRNEFTRCLHEILNEISPDKKEAVILRYQEDKTIAEIAEIQNCPEGSVKSRIHYTLKILEQKLQQ